ncbi:MAG: TetR/AcrR family transcriptional regulator, partial [Gemmatimonadales bacterium]
MGQEESVGQEELEKKTRQRLAPEVRRAQILDAALEVFGEQGFQRATLQDVMDRTGVTKGAFYHYFESKEELFLALVRDRFIPSVLADKQLMIRWEGSREEMLRQLIERIWQKLREPGQIELTRLVITEVPRFPGLRDVFYNELLLPFRRSLREALAPGIKCGDVPREAAEAVVVLIPDMVMGVALGR